MDINANANAQANAEAQTRESIISDITFKDVNGNDMTKSKAFEKYTNYFFDNIKYLNYVSRPSERMASGKAVYLIYRSVIAPEVLDDHLIGDDARDAARKGEREVETQIKVSTKYSTTPDQFDNLVQQFALTGMQVKEIILAAHASEAARKIDYEILKAYNAVRQESGTSQNTIGIEINDKEYWTKEEANEFVRKLIREGQKVRNKITSQSRERVEAPAAAFVTPPAMTAIIESDFYTTSNVQGKQSSVRSGKVYVNELGGLDVVEIPEWDPINSSLYPDLTDLAAMIHVDVLGGTFIQELNEDKEFGGSVYNFNIRGIYGFGPIHDKDNRRIGFIKFGTVTEDPVEGTISNATSDATGVITFDALITGADGTAEVLNSSGTAEGTADALVDGTTATGLTRTVTANGDYTINIKKADGTIVTSQNVNVVITPPAPTPDSSEEGNK